MRLARHGSPGAERPVAAGSDGVWHDLTPLTADITPEFLATGLRGLPATLQTLPRVERLERYGPPVTGLGKIVCIGLNYRDHAAETGAKLPTEPILFLKAPDTVVGPDDEVIALDLGSVLVRGTPYEVVNDPQVVAAYLGSGAAVADDGVIMDLRNFCGHSQEKDSTERLAGSRP